ncbi:MAG: hypothetical protein II792_01395 [Prevotella sp.]|nr:hypothetical protein [Prevotella sp.]
MATAAAAATISSTSWSVVPAPMRAQRMMHNAAPNRYQV